MLHIQCIIYQQKICDHIYSLTKSQCLWSFNDNIEFLLKFNCFTVFTYIKHGRTFCLPEFSCSFAPQFLSLRTLNVFSWDEDFFFSLVFELVSHLFPGSIKRSLKMSGLHFRNVQIAFFPAAQTLCETPRSLVCLLLTLK